MIFWSVVFVVSLVVLLRASDYFVDSSIVIGKSFGIPNHIIGITLVALGTSLPELASSIFAVLDNSTEFVAGNVVGSNNANIFLVLGCTAVIAGFINIKVEQIAGFIPFLLGSAALLVFTCHDGLFDRKDALIGCAAMVAFLFYSLKINAGENEEEEENQEDQSIFTNVVIFCLAIVAINFSAKYLIESVEKIAEILVIGKDIIAQTAVALGTSLPELIVSLMAIKKGKQDIAVGNVVGSNIFNAFAIMSIPALIKPLVITQEIINFSLPLMVLATVLFLFFIADKKISRIEGIVLLTFYLFFIAFLIF